jgi:hypothetical protein
MEMASSLSLGIKAAFHDTLYLAQLVKKIGFNYCHETCLMIFSLLSQTSFFKIPAGVSLNRYWGIHTR